MKSGLSGLVDRFFWSGGLNRALLLGAAAATLAACEGKTPTPPPVDNNPGSLQLLQGHEYEQAPQSVMAGENFTVSGSFMLEAEQDNGVTDTKTDSILVYRNNQLLKRQITNSRRWDAQFMDAKPTQEGVRAEHFWTVTYSNPDGSTERLTRTGMTPSGARAITVEEPVEMMSVVIDVNQYDPFAEGKVGQQDSATLRVKNLTTGLEFFVSGDGQIEFETVKSDLEITPVYRSDRLPISLQVDDNGMCYATDAFNDTPILWRANETHRQFFNAQKKYVFDGYPHEGGDANGSQTGGHLPWDVLMFTRARYSAAAGRGFYSVMPREAANLKWVTLLGSYPGLTTGAFNQDELANMERMLADFQTLNGKSLCGNSWFVDRIDVQPGADIAQYFTPESFGSAEPNPSSGHIVVYRQANDRNPLTIVNDDGYRYIDAGLIKLTGQDFHQWVVESLLAGMSGNELIGDNHEGCTVSQRAGSSPNPYCLVGSPGGLDGVVTGGTLYADDEAASIAYNDFAVTFMKANPTKNFSWWNPAADGLSPAQVSQAIGAEAGTFVLDRDILKPQVSPGMERTQAGLYVSRGTVEAVRRNALPEDMLRSEDRAQAMGIPLTYAATPTGN